MSDKTSAAAAQFAAEWEGRGYEKGETQPFWLSLLHRVFGIDNPEHYIRFEDRVKMDNTAFIDGFIPATAVMIEQKSLGKSLSAPIRQSDGALLTPFQQAKRYITNLPRSAHPRWLITCNFAEFWVYDMEQPNNEPQKILLKDLDKEYYRLEFLLDKSNAHIEKELDLSVKAGALVGLVYDAFAKGYGELTAADLRSLNILCVRLVFCLYAENAGLFGRYGIFHDYLSAFPLSQQRKALVELFTTLNTPLPERDRFLAADNPLLALFPYVNGGLFAEEDITIPPFTAEISDIILNKASAGFNWSEISPTIFGAVFESTLNPETRRAAGMHYTSIQNIHKVIDPLFLDALREELATISALTDRRRQQALRTFQQHLATITILDPACGSGNFLTEAYIALRRLENSVLRELAADNQIALGGEFSPIQVSLAQFYGIEINDFAVAVARTALWIAEHQMMRETETIVGTDLDFLPLKSYTNIVEGNALSIDWQTVAPKEKLTYIIGNPPFSGYSLQSKEQKEELRLIAPMMGKNIDYVAGWYVKTAQLMRGTNIRAALVATNSITQGEQVAAVWKPLFEHFGIHIDFAYRTFRWDSESANMAHVHCVIVGFSCAANDKPKVIYVNDQQRITASNINAYLVNAPDIFIESRTTSICDVPVMHRGSQPTDDGNYLFTAEEREEFIRREPRAEQYFRPFMSSGDFIRSTPRYCLWLVDASPSELRKCPTIMKRIAAVREFRLNSKKEATRRKADTPTLFDENQQPNTNFVAIPEVSSERRRYVPIDFLSHDIVVGNSIRIVENATLYHFGILTSNVHNAWMRAVCGRLKSDYRYSKDIVYNNFPWPCPTPEQRARIEQTAQAILSARSEYPDSSLADLYDETAMPPKLRKAHQDNDHAVMAAYGWTSHSAEYTSESAAVATLMTLYKTLTTQ